jgi:MYXO-CTERM domain-containing protein
MLKRFVATAALAAGLMGSAQDARACGGFFCSRSPVDQSSERILFVTGPTTTTMVVQVAYAGGDADFSWVLPLGAVPQAGSLEVFPQMALNSLDANTGPQFNFPDDCWRFWPQAGSVEDGSTNGGGGGGGVNVHIREEVGPYDVAVVESADPAALTAWLRTNGYRITSPMEPYIRTYTDEGMKFLALKLLPGATVNQIEPLKLTLPGTVPSVPIRLSAIAAMPEMGMTVMVLGNQRYQPANWPLVTINDNEIAFDPSNPWGANGTNWSSLVARKIDEAGGQGFVTEYAGSTAEFLQMITASPVNTDEQQRAKDALLGVMQDNPYMTRLYARLSPEEMRSDPIFRRSELGDVSRVHDLSRYVDGVDLCSDQTMMPPGNPCDFAACGAGGTCAVDAAGNAGCACLDLATARPMTSPEGRPTVSCQDTRMSFVNPGDVDEATGTRLGDPCQTVGCGDHGRCVAVNLTPTCQCDRGFIAVNNNDGMRCQAPVQPIPETFYLRQMPDPAHPGRDLGGPPSRNPSVVGCACAVPFAGTPWATAGLMVGLFAVARRRRQGARGMEQAG